MGKGLYYTIIRTHILLRELSQPLVRAMGWFTDWLSRLDEETSQAGGRGRGVGTVPGCGGRRVREQLTAWFWGS
jgi:hypothetical protein